MKENESLSNKTALAPYKTAIARYIRSVMVLKNVRYDDLADTMASQGIVLTASNLRNKVSKGLFSADMLVMIIEALGVEEIALAEILKQVHAEWIL